MKKRAVAIFMAFGMSLLLAACGGGEEPETSPAETQKEEETTEAPATTEVPVTTEAEETETVPETKGLDAFEFNFDELVEAVQGLDADVLILEPKQTDRFYVQGIKIGKSYDEACTWLYCFSNISSPEEIVGVKISCAETPNSLMKEIYDDTVSTFWKCSELLSGGGLKAKGVTSKISSGEAEDEGWYDTLVYVNEVDLSGEAFQGPLVNYGALAVSEDMPVATWGDIINGSFDNQTVYIDGVADNVMHGDKLQFDLYFEHDGGYEVLTFYLDEKETAYLETQIPEGLKNGDVLRISQSILRSGALWPQFITAEKVDEMAVEEFHAAYKAGCPELDYDAVARVPVGSDVEAARCRFTGKVVQVISEGSQHVSPEYLVKSGGQYVYISYKRGLENREQRFLKDDSVTACGNFTKMITYDTLVGKNTVPYIEAYLMELD